MKTFLSRIAFASAVLGSIAVLTTVAYANHSWGGYHWARTANPFTLKLGDNVSVGWDAYLAQASTDWNVSTVLDTAIVAGSTNPKNCRPKTGRVEVCNSKYGNNGWLGLASIWASGEHITQGTVKFNDTYFATPTYNTPAWRQMVACQEVAHTFGLDHQDEAFDNPNLGTCMDYTNDPTRNDGFGNNLHPNAHDFEELATIYAHVDATSTVDQSAAVPGARLGQDADFTNASEWGKAIRFSADGKPSVFVRHLGNDQEVFTFVVWANEQ
jgi:hypothetical protein